MTSDASTIQRIKDNFRTATRLSRTQVAIEAELNTTKWFDYRFLTPMQATELFSKSYAEKYRLKFGRNVDSSQASKTSGTRSHRWDSSSRELSSFWVARQFADSMGIPYDYFIEPAMQALMDIGYKRIPRPNQLYAAKTRRLICTKAHEHWTEWTETARLMWSELPQYHIDVFRGLPAQIAHQDWIVKQLKARHARPEHIGEMCFVNAVLCPDRAEEEFGSEKLERARMHVVDYRTAEMRAKIDVPDTDYKPGCYGVAGAMDPNAETCGACKELNACGKFASNLSRMVIQKCGTSDPVDDRRRRQQRDRTRRFREKRAATAGAGAAKKFGQGPY